MSIEKSAVKATSDVTRKTIRTAESLVHKAWTVLDAASEKRPPSDVLSQKAVKAIQGETPG